jgi:ribulose-5-phosphate 4-epimerase/fuculose-1-phosphate aldolase
LAVACSKEGLRYDNFYSVTLAGRIAYHPFEGITVNPEEKERLVKNLGDKNLLILKNHGLLVGGSSIEAMFFDMFALQRACEVQVEFDKTGRPVEPVAQEVLDATQGLMKTQLAGNEKGKLEFDAMTRKVRAQDDSFIDV